MNKKVENISHGALFIGLGVLALLDSWWPGLIIVLGIFFTLKNALSKNYFKMLISVLSFVGAYICYSMREGSGSSISCTKLINGASHIVSFFEATLTEEPT